jgi:hypothetical protein
MTINPDGTFNVERDDDAIACPQCKGYAERVECNNDELKKFNCGRPYECCARAFVCIKCGHRAAMKAPAPEMN